MSVLMSYSQFSYLNLHLHGLIYDHSVLPWQDQPSINKKNIFKWNFKKIYLKIKFIIDLYDKLYSLLKNELVEKIIV